MHESVDGIHLGTISADNTYKHFDFTTFDMISIIKLTIEPIDFAFITCENDLHHKIAMYGINHVVVTRILMKFMFFRQMKAQILFQNTK